MGHEAGDEVLKAVAERLEMNLSGSFGISLFPRDGREMDVLIRKADAAMYHAKQQRGRYWIHDPADA